jgi:hypothetical protein
LALHGKGISTAEISRSMVVSEEYVRQVVGKNRRAGIMAVLRIPLEAFRFWQNRK